MFFFSFVSFLLFAVVPSNENDTYTRLYALKIIIIVGFIVCKIDTNPLMRLSPRRENPGPGMG